MLPGQQAHWHHKRAHSLVPVKRMKQRNGTKLLCWLSIFDPALISRDGAV
uniref:Uncharacterized protein n=1 Tax=Picea glauca TaxID=3330 RepID=A0A117NJF4_PICGL|nr:hypothetical protein ABT39_MTgene1288 [Picea glauca]QHR87238.1 hypothetical protein Q903MT_gene1247 [Picea sitchensis]